MNGLSNAETVRIAHRRKGTGKAGAPPLAPSGLKPEGPADLPRGPSVDPVWARIGGLAGKSLFSGNGRWLKVVAVRDDSLTVFIREEIPLRIERREVEAADRLGLRGRALSTAALRAGGIAAGRAEFVAGLLRAISA